MRIGIVSDTHNNIKNVKKVIRLFNNSKVEKVIHTGDITQPKVLTHFKAVSYTHLRAHET